MEQPSLAQVVTGYIPAQILHVTAELGLADALADGPHTYQDLAARTNTHPRTLRRLLRALVGQGIVSQIDADTFELTELGSQLRTDVPDSQRDVVLLSAAPVLFRAWGQLAEIVRTGEPARQPDTGWTPFEWLLQDTDGLAPKFHDVMGQSTRAIGPAIAETCDFSRFGTVADIGGGDGNLVGAILAAVPGLRGVLYDLPSAVTTAPDILRELGVEDRCEIVGGNFFESVPSGADAYVLKYILHDWSDEQVVTILRNCREAMSTDARLFIVETVVPSILKADDPIAGADLGVLVGTGGAERTADEYRDLLDAAGFTLKAISDVLADGEPSGYNAIEGIPTA